MFPPFSRIEMNGQNEGHMDRLREKQYVFGGCGGGGTVLQNCKRSCAHKVAT